MTYCPFLRGGGGLSVDCDVHPLQGGAYGPYLLLVPVCDFGPELFGARV